MATTNSASYVTEADVRVHARQVFESKRQALLESDPARAKKDYDPAKLDSAAWEDWIQGCLAAERRQQRLITARQKADLTTGRTLHEGDRARFVAETRSESLGDGRTYVRASGQLGVIVQVEMQSSGAPVYLFRPDANAAETEIFQLRTARWTDLERVE